MGFLEGCQDCSDGSSEGNLKEQTCQPKENVGHPDSLTHYYILYELAYKWLHE